VLGPAWEDVDFDAGTALVRRASVSVDGRGQQLGNVVFTNPTGELVLRQAVAKIVEQAGKTAGIAAELGTHTGRRTVVTTPFVDGDEALEDIARFAGHARPATTAGYVMRLGVARTPSLTGCRHPRRR
jgi:site-specific recombinase XerD